MIKLTTATDAFSLIIRIKDGLNASHVIIYGHNMGSGAMFGTLARYKNSGFYQTEGNDVFYIYTEDVIREYKIFTVYITDPISDTFTFNFSNLSGLREYAKERPGGISVRHRCRCF